MTRRPIPALFGLVILFALAAPGCWQRPLREGTQMREFPEGFRFEDNVDSGADLFPGLGRLPMRGYLCLSQDDEVSDISMSEYPSVVTEAELRAAFESRKASVRFPHYGELEPVRVGQRDGWGWTEKQFGRDGRVTGLKWSVVLPYDDRTFLLEYYSTMPRHMDLAAMRAQLDQFAYVRNGRIVK